MDPTVQTALIGLGTAIAGALAGFMVKRAEKAPDVQAILNSAVKDVIKHYTDALAESRQEIREMRSEIEGLRETVENQSAVISELEEHVDVLTTALVAAGVATPKRRVRSV